MRPLLAFLLTTCSAFATAPAIPADRIEATLHALPGYGVFDYLSYRTVDGKIILTGDVTNRDLKDQAEKAVRALPGIAAVQNEIRLLPDTAADNEVRQAVYHAVYSGPAPSIYEPEKAIHIIVRNREVTLEGKVKSDIDRMMIASAAAGAGNVFNVTDHLVAAAPDSPDAQWRRNMDAIAGKSPDKG